MGARAQFDIQPWKAFSMPAGQGKPLPQGIQPHTRPPATTQCTTQPHKCFTNTPLQHSSGLHIPPRQSAQSCCVQLTDHLKEGTRHTAASGLNPAPSDASLLQREKFFPQNHFRHAQGLGTAAPQRPSFLPGLPRALGSQGVQTPHGGRVLHPNIWRPSCRERYQTSCSFHTDLPCLHFQTGGTLGGHYQAFLGSPPTTPSPLRPGALQSSPGPCPFIPPLGSMGPIIKRPPHTHQHHFHLPSPPLTPPQHHQRAFWGLFKN